MCVYMYAFRVPNIGSQQLTAKNNKQKTKINQLKEPAGTQ